MALDRLLASVLRGLQTPQPSQDISRLLSTAATLLTSLSNPRNITLLTAHILTAPTVWDEPDGLRSCFRVFGTFSSAAATITRNEQTPSSRFQLDGKRSLSKEKWVAAVVQGADQGSPRWRHLIAIGGLFLGFEGQGREALSGSLRSEIESALVQATNLTLTDAKTSRGLNTECVALVLSHTFELLSESLRASLDYNALLPVLVDAAFFSTEGFNGGYLVGAAKKDFVPASKDNLNWSTKSPTFLQIQKLSNAPLVSSMGPLSRLIGHAVEVVADPNLAHKVVGDLAGFSRILASQWRHSKMSEVDEAEASASLHGNTQRSGMPILWQVLKAVMFASVVVLRAVLGRMLGDRILSDSQREGCILFYLIMQLTSAGAPYIATEVLHTLRNLYFISSRLGPNAFTSYNFVSLTAVDILSHFPQHAHAFLDDTKPDTPGRIPNHPFERCMDLYFLNTAEYFTAVLSPQANEDLLVPAAMPYLSSSSQSNLVEIFEAAHSLMLAVYMAPQNAELTAKTLPFYVDAVFKVCSSVQDTTHYEECQSQPQAFPLSLSPRQFRLAFKTLIRVSSPPAALFGTQPDLSATLLELIRERAVHSPTKPQAPPSRLN
ncbi:MAG: hypothetical protein M1833_003124, partial [Piccolia ochrophora]